MTDSVNHPQHYNQYTGFEVIDVCTQLRAPDGQGNFNRGNAFKYLARAGWKDEKKHVEDLEKAIFYIQEEIKRISLVVNVDTPSKSHLKCLVCDRYLFMDTSNRARCDPSHGWYIKMVTTGNYIWYSTNTVALKCPVCEDRPGKSTSSTLWFCPNDCGYYEKQPDRSYIWTSMLHSLT